ncbi:fluoride efflux transporter FluC [Sporosarcina beigongshangi]|uniref:fluoride efflux transporter FluC n=1 Tax=Sporosarcina beigongshangi TaxID=2782538 RepID=UPI0019393431|nr:CrcB family protein [Sporosarcina beigongshangi]
MTFLDVVLVGIGGFLGAVIRYVTTKKMNHTVGIPVGTLVVNWFGALLIGLVFGLELSSGLTLLLASGFAGALTTFSTLHKELIELWRNGKKRYAVCYLLLTYGGGLILAAIGYAIGSI